MISLSLAAALALAAGAPADGAPASEPERVTLVKAARLIDGRGGAPVKDAAVLIRGGRIVAVGRAVRIKAPPGAHAVDLGKATLLPGLVDCRVHAADAASLDKALAAGFTTVRQAGGSASTAGGAAGATRRGGRAGLAFASDAGEGLPMGDNALRLSGLVELGLSTRDAVAAATRHAASFLGRDDIGTVVVGRRADLIAVAGDPLTDIAELERVHFVMKDGRTIRIDIAELPGALLTTPATAGAR